MGGILGGDEPEMVQMSPAPEPFKFGSFKDLLNNVETVQTTGADGKEHFVQKMIKPDNPSIERFLEEAKNSIGGLIRDISVVARENPRLVAPFQGFIQEVSALNDQNLADWTNTVRPEDFTALKDNLIQTNTFLNNESWDDYDHNMEINLTARGLADSAVGNDARVRAQRGRAISNDQIRNQAELVSDQMVNSDLARKTQMYQGRQASRGRASDIAGQQYGLEQGEVDRNLMGRDDRMQKLMTMLGLNQNAINEDTNRKRGANIAPTVLGAQDAITGRQQSAWAQTEQNKLNQYQIGMQKYQSDNALTGSIVGGLATAGSLFAAPYMFPALAGNSVATGAGGQLARLAR